MNAKPLAERRHHLLAQAAAQRSALARDIAVWRKPLALADQGLVVLRSLKRHSVWMAAGFALFATHKPARLSRWLRRGWVAWCMLRDLRVR